MKINKLDRFETKTPGEPSPEQIEQSKQTFVNLLTPVIEKMLKSPGDIKPVKESFEELARQAKSGVKRSESDTLIISGGAEKVIQIPKSDTLHNSGGEENSGKSKFTDIEIELLRQIENAE
jgi:hypothetical protein